MAMEEEDLEDILPLCETIREFLTKSDEERAAEIEQDMLNKNKDIIDDPHDISELVAIIDSDKKPDHQSPLPESENLPGEFNFSVDFSKIAGKVFAYSPTRNKLYVTHNSSCAFVFKTELPIPINCHLRIMSIFVDPEYSNFDVHRCLTHALKDFKNGICAADHIIRCDNHPGKYVRNVLTLRRSLIVPCNPYDSAELLSTQLLRFVCRSSCVGGMNRRPIKVIFTLENGDIVIGRRSVEVKICSCPLRDLERDEAKPAAVKRGMSPVPNEVPFFFGNTLKDVNPLRLQNTPTPKKPRTDKPSTDTKIKKQEMERSPLGHPHKFFFDVSGLYSKMTASNSQPFTIKVRNKQEYAILMNAKTIYEFTKIANALQLPDQLTKCKKPKEKSPKN